MFGNFFSALDDFFRGKRDDTSAAKEIEPPLFKQQHLLTKHGDTQGGLCAPLSNLYAKHRLGLESDDFLSHPDVAYRKAVTEEKHQSALSQEGKDGLHSAFVDSGVRYETTEVPTKAIASAHELDKLLSKHPHVLLTYPTRDGGGKKHMIYLGRSTSQWDKCYQYDANRYTSSLFAPCTQITAFTAKQLAEESTNDDQTTTIAAAGLFD